MKKPTSPSWPINYPSFVSVFASIPLLDSVVSQMNPFHVLKPEPILLFKFYTSVMHSLKWTVHSVDTGNFVILCLIIGSASIARNGRMSSDVWNGCEIMRL